MKKQWKEPRLQNISVELTQGIEPIISSGFELNPTYSWKCPCCFVESGHIFDTDAAAREDFHNNHVPVCPEYNRVTGTCEIS